MTPPRCIRKSGRTAHRLAKEISYPQSVKRMALDRGRKQLRVVAKNEQEGSVKLIDNGKKRWTRCSLTVFLGSLVGRHDDPKGLCSLVLSRSTRTGRQGVPGNTRFCRSSNICENSFVLSYRHHMESLSIIEIAKETRNHIWRHIVWLQMWSGRNAWLKSRGVSAFPCVCTFSLRYGGWKRLK